MSAVEDVIVDLGDLDAQHLRSSVDEDGVLLRDEDGEFRLDDSIGSPELAAAALRRAAATMLARAIQLERRARASQHYT